jgi:two-component system, OmpR family, response regulator
MRILVVEDDVKLVRALRRGLVQEGYEVEVANTGDAALEMAVDQDYDAVVLDIMLPGRDGFAVCRALRERERWVPVIMLTARADVRDRIRGLDEGADDYLVKPFDFGELLARLRALIRREPADRGALLEAGDLLVDPETRIVTRDGDEIELTARELAVLEVLARNAGHVVTRAELLGQVWDEDYDGSPNVVDVYVGYLRRKLEHPSGPRLIRTVRGVGFVLESH